MPAFTLQTLMSEATALVGGATDLTPSTVSLYVNLAQLEVARSLPMGEMEATTTYSVAASATSVALPSDFDEPIAFTRTTGAYDWGGHRTLTPTPIRVIDDASNGTSTGLPGVYAIHDQAAYLYPQPTSALSLQLRYRKVPTDLTALTSVPSLHTRYHPAILYKAAEQLAMRKMDPQTAAFLRNTYLSYMQATPSTQEVRVRSETTR